MQDVAQSRLPSHHISRPRLTAPCAGARVVAVEAAGGYGKSVLGAELVDASASLPVWVALEEGEVPARLFVARLRAAVNRAGLLDAAGAMAAGGDDPPGAIDALLTALADEQCTLVIDDAHHAARDAAGLIDRIAANLPASLRLIVLARHLPRGLERLRRADARHLSAADLALAPDETLELCRSGFGLPVSAADARLLDAATGGWTAATVLAASRSRQADESIAAVARIAALPGIGARQHDAMQSILDEALSRSGHDRDFFSQLAAVPVFDETLLAEITGKDGVIDRALAWGLPLTRTDDGWWRLPDPVREHLAGTPDERVLLIAARYYERRGELDRALQMVLGADRPAAAAELLDRAEPWVIDRVDALELLSVLDRIPGPVLDRFPRAMLNVARCCAAGWLHRQSSELLARLDATADARTAPELRRAVDAELITELLNQGNPVRALEPGRRLLAAAGADERLTRARALTIVGQAKCWQRDKDGTLPAASLFEAGDYLARATKLHLALDNRPAAATVTLFRAIWVELALGRPAAALEVLDQGLQFAANHPRRLVRVRFYRAQLLGELGRYEEMEDELAEVQAMAGRLGDEWMRTYLDIQRMTVASARGEAGATLHHAQRVEAQRGSWWAIEGAMFLAEAADCLDRVGHTAVAVDYLDRARHDPQNAEPVIAMSECALLARHGDPELARARLAVVHRHGIAPRELWRVKLLMANAAFRQGDRAAGVLASASFEEAARLGHPQAPLLRERELTESLLALAVDTGLPHARAIEISTLPLAVAVLGRFELTRGGRPVTLGSGQETRLLKLVAAHAGSVNVEEVIEALWPETPPEAGRNRLRTVLNRLRQLAPDVVVRDGERLTIGPEVRLDLAEFAADARAARAIGAASAPATTLARSAIARYRGPLLPHDPFEEWAEEPRERARRTMLDLLDLCAEAAIVRGDLDEARRTVERTIELAPYDDHRYLQAASILYRQGRKGAALSVLRRARSALAQLGVDPPATLVEFERRVAAVGTARESAVTVPQL